MDPEHVSPDHADPVAIRIQPAKSRRPHEARSLLSEIMMRRLTSLALACAAALGFAACASPPPLDQSSPPADLLGAGFDPGAGTGSSPTPPKTTTPPTKSQATTTNPSASPASATGVTTAPGIDPATAGHPEVLYLIMDGKDGWTWFCTATLVSSTIAITAAHCLQSELFLTWRVKSPTLAGTPTVNVTKVAMYDDQWADVAHPDIGIVQLESGISLPQYGVMTDVSTQVDSGAKVQVQTIVRTAEEPEAPLHMTGAMPLSSTVKYGYDHGYGVPMYSHGGDSGAGLFLVENGQMSHKVVAIESEPDPDRNLDQLSRVEAAFITWVGQQTGQKF
jgi:hypothetical protein